MRHKVFDSLPQASPTALTKRMAAQDMSKDELVWRGGRYVKTGKILTCRRYLYILQVSEVDGCLAVSVYHPLDIRNGEEMPLLEVYLDTEAREYTTKVYEATVDPKSKKAGRRYRWSDASIMNAIPYTRRQRHTDKYYSMTAYGERSCFISPKDQKKLKEKGIDLREDSIRDIQRWQQKILDERRQRKERLECEPWDREMSYVPEIPKEFLYWAHHDGNPYGFIIFHPNKGKQKAGYCTICEDEVRMEKPLRHGENGTCPKCGKMCTQISDGRMHVVYEEGHTVRLMQKLNGGGVVERQFFVRRSFRRSALTGRIDPASRDESVAETSRVLWRDEKNYGEYVWDNYKQRVMRWVKTRAPYIPEERGMLYPKNLKEVELEISQKMSRHCTPYLFRRVSFRRCVIKGTPFLEKLCKAGLIELAQDVIGRSTESFDIDVEERELHKALKIDKARMARLREMKGKGITLRYLQEEKRQNTVWPDEMFEFYENTTIQLSGWEMGRLMEYFQTPVRVWAYLKKQHDISSNGYHTIIRQWVDYISMAKNLKMNLNSEQIWKPKDVEAAHNRCISLLKNEEIREEAVKIRKKFPKAEKSMESIQKYEYAAGAYCIVAPKKIDDIVAEGISLNHCVHRSDIYFDRISQKETFLMFLRRKTAPDQPWYTLEIEPGGNIRQKRTTGDRQKKDLEDAIPFLQKWQKRVRKMMTAEEKKLAAASDRKRKEGYRQIRKEQKKIWHGPLAGKLLADVLEADFLAVGS